MNAANKDETAKKEATTHQEEDRFFSCKVCGETIAPRQNHDSDDCKNFILKEVAFQDRKKKEFSNIGIPENRDEDCCICLEAVPLWVHNGNNGNTDLTRMLCCGKTMHRTCLQNFRTTAKVNIDQCALCRTNYFSEQGSIQRLIELANQGKAWAQNGIGVRYLAGEGIKRSKKKATKFLTMAAKQGHAESQFALAIHLEKSQEKKFQLLISSANQGYPRAQDVLGLMYASGNGVEFSLETARKWFKKGISNGRQVCADRLRMIDHQCISSSVEDLVCTMCGTLETLETKLIGCEKCKFVGVSYCSNDCKGKHWEEGGHKEECEEKRCGMKEINDSVKEYKKALFGALLEEVVDSGWNLK
jgi:hypothetical protein